MKKLLSAFLIGLGLAFVGLGVYTLGNESRCDKSFDRMNAVLKCIEKAPCLYFSTDLYEGRRASRHYKAHCELYELRRSQKE